MKNHLTFKTSMKTYAVCLICLASVFTAEAQNATIDSTPLPKKQEQLVQPQPTETDRAAANTDTFTPAGNSEETDQPAPKQSPMEFSQENFLKNVQNIDEWVFWSVGGVLLALILIATLSRNSSERQNKNKKKAADMRSQENSYFSHSRQFNQYENNLEELPTLCVAPPPGHTSGAGAKKRVLAILEEPSTGRSWNITEARTDIGRGSKNDICLNDNSVSSVHCALKLDEDGIWTLIDLNSTNHIYANGQILTTLELRHNMEFELGKIRLKFKIC